MASLWKQTPELVRFTSPSGKVVVSIRENGVALQRVKGARDDTWKKKLPAGSDVTELVVRLASKGWKADRPYMVAVEEAKWAKRAEAPLFAQEAFAL